MAAVEVVVSAPFGGKGRYARSEVARREAAGELGLIILDWSKLFAALVPGVQSQFRDEAVSDSGSPRAVGAAFDWLLGAIAVRELSGYVLSQSPTRGLAIADSFGARLIEVEAAPDVVAARAVLHMQSMGRTVTRAQLSASMPRCRRTAADYFNAAPRLVGRAYVARQRGKGYQVDEQPKKPFNREVFERGLTAQGRDALSELKALGNLQPTPAQILEFILKNRVSG